MRVLVTGATGLIGRPVVAELLACGHTVLALTRSAASAAAAEAAGPSPCAAGSATSTCCARAAVRADGVVHLAFDHELSGADALARAIAEEGAALAALGEELAGSDRTLVTVSGTPWIAGRVSTEADPLPTEGPRSPAAAARSTLSWTWLSGGSGACRSGCRGPSTSAA